jgi:hypothetical protein
MKRAECRDRSLSSEIREWVMSTNGVFLSSDVHKCLHLSSRQKLENASEIFRRLCDEGLIVRHGSKAGCFRTIDGTCDDIDWQNASLSDALDVRYPFAIDDYFLTLPKNIIIVAGQVDAGKTAFLLDFVRRNMSKHEVYYFNSEMGEVEMKSRLEKFELPPDKWRFYPKSRSSNFADVIRPDAINVIDFLEIYKDFYEIGGHIRDIHDRLNKGIAVIAIQKNPNTDMGLGAMRSMKKARLYLAMEPGKLKIVKAKNWRNSINPKNLEIEFKIVNGCKFIQESNWKKPENPQGVKKYGAKTN